MICDARRFERPGVTHEYRQDAFCASDGACPMEDVRTHHRTPQRRCRGAYLELCRCVSRDGLRAVDVARIPARHRGLSCLQSDQTVSHGFEERACTLDFGRRLESEGLAHLSRVGNAPDYARPRALHQRANECRSGCDGLRAGLHHHRPCA